MPKILTKDIFGVFLLITFFIIIYTFISINKHNHFQTFAWDTSFFVQELYFVDKFQSPYTSLSGMNALGDHFQVTFLVLGGIIYQIWHSPESIFFLQAVMVCLSTLPLYLISRNLLKETKISSTGVYILSYALVFGYLFSVSTQGMLTDEMHNDPLAALPLLFVIYFFLQKRWLGYWISFTVLLLTKETYGLFAVPLGIFMLLVNRCYRQAIITMFAGLFTFWLLVSLIMPSLGKTNGYFHFSSSNNPSYLAANFLANPSLVFTKFIDKPEKIQTIVVGLTSFGFLPFFSQPQFLILPAASLAVRFYDDSTPLLHQYNNHYSAPFIPFLALASVWGIYRIVLFARQHKHRWWKIIWIPIVLYLIGFSLLQDLIFHGAVNSLLKPSFYSFQSWEVDAHELIKQIPPEVTVASQNSLLPHFSERDNFYLLPEYGNAEFIAVDLTDGPNKFSPANYSDIKNLVDELVANKKYQVVWQKGQSMLLKKTVN
jgi:uncharacterized membrane protein